MALRDVLDQPEVGWPNAWHLDSEAQTRWPRLVLGHHRHDGVDRRGAAGDVEQDELPNSRIRRCALAGRSTLRFHEPVLMVAGASGQILTGRAARSQHSSLYSDQ